MNHSAHHVSVAIFLATMFGTFVVSYLGRRHTRKEGAEGLSGQRLNKWLVGLSAGAAANSGFVVTGAVGLGYTAGAQWILLPLAWLLGDIVFWSVFPERINRVGAASKATTLTDVVVHQLEPAPKRVLKLLIAVIVLLCLGGYVSAQWLAGQKFLHGAFGFGDALSLVMFAALIVIYTAVGGFRGSVYTDTFQAIIRVIGTVIAVVAVLVAASHHRSDFWHNIHAAGPDFLKLIPHRSALTFLAFVVGFAMAALGFGLGQPQMVTRYLAGESPSETRSAWWIYMGFVQFTWIAMTFFGIVLRGVLPHLDDPETGLSTFFRSETGPVLTGIIVADIFATIAATSNSLLVAMAQTVRFDLFEHHAGERTSEGRLWPVTATLGVATMIVSLNLNSSVVSLALSSVSLMGAGLAPVVLVRVLGLRYSGKSLALSVAAGLGVAVAWRAAGFGGLLNEAAPGMLAGLCANWILAPRRAGRRELRGDHG